jgi:transcriptional antiterminator RfaH
METREQTLAWYLAQVRPNAGHIAERNLVRQGFQIFAPTQQETRRQRGRFVTTDRPLFPGYLFIAGDPEGVRWRAINGTYGVSKLVTFGESVPAPVPSDLINGLMERCDMEGRLLPPQALNIGDHVHVLSGPFAQFIATVEQIAPNRRVWVLLDLLGGSTRVAISPDMLKKV